MVVKALDGSLLLIVAMAIFIIMFREFCEPLAVSIVNHSWAYLSVSVAVLLAAFIALNWG